MIEGYMQVDLNDPLAVKYHKVALKSFECVSDIFRINVVQCITPDTLLDLPFSEDKRRSPQEKASLCSQYRMHKRMSVSDDSKPMDRFFIMEHDAYLRPDQEETFRMIMSKWEQMITLNIGIAMECYTCKRQISKLFCEAVENDKTTKMTGPMGILHTVTDAWVKKNNLQVRAVYWPKIGKDNKTGVAFDVTRAHRKPQVVIEAPVTQLIDTNLGTTVIDRPESQVKNYYNQDTHPNFHFVDLSLKSRLDNPDITLV